MNPASPYIMLLIVVLVGFGGLVWLMLKKFQELKEAQRNDALTQVMNQNLHTMHERLDKAAQYMGSLGKELGKMQEIGKNIDDLRLAFSSSKLRGNFGERVLQDMLEMHFPKELYVMQFKFKEGQTVDAIIRTKDGIIPIDSKFPIESYRRLVAATTEDARAFERNELFKAVRKHLTDIAKKYILPGEGTMSFAIMYVPSEALFYEIISASDELPDLAKQMKVMMVSPNTMSYFLHILRLGHERIRIEENVQRVWELITGFQQETAKFGEALSVTARHVTNAKNAMDAAVNDYGKLSSKVEQIKELK